MKRGTFNPDQKHTEHGLGMLVCSTGEKCTGHTHLAAAAAGSLVVHGDVAEQVGHGLPVVDAADGLRQYHADIHGLDFGTLELLDFMGDGVGHHHLRVESSEIVLRLNPCVAFGSF